MRAMDDQRTTQQRRAERMATLATLARPVQHEINNLLTVIFANIEMLKRTAAEGAPQRQLDRVQEAARRFDASSRALLSLARRADPAETEVTLPEAIAALRPLLQLLLPAPGALGLDLAPEGAPVRLDRGLLDETLLRLALEVAESAPRGAAMALTAGGRPDAAELGIRLPRPASAPLRQALRQLAEGAGGALAEAEDGAALRLTLPRYAPAALPA